MAKLRKALKAAERRDVAAALALAAWRDHPLVRMLAAFAQIADQTPALGLGASLFALALMRGDARLRHAAVRLVLAILLTTALKVAVERQVARTRPNAVLNGKRYRRKRGGPKRPKRQSFPSGHTADAVAAARSLARDYPELSAPVWVAAALVTLVQLPAGAHYPSDLAAGALIGVLGDEASELLLRAVPSRVQRSSPGLQDA